MRFLLFVTHTLPLISLYANSLFSGEFGYREPNVFKSYIYTTSLNENFFKNSTPHIGYTFPFEHNYNILLHFEELLHLEVSGRDGYFLESLEYLFIDDESYHLSNYNVFSHNLYNKESSIHHSLFYLRKGIYSYGLFTVFNFSPIYAMGNKSILYSDLNLHNFQLLQMFEIRENYLTPDGDTQKNTIRNKNIITLTSFQSLIPKLYLMVTYEDEILDTTQRLSLFKRINNTELSLHFQHRNKDLTELLCKFNVKLPISFFTLTVEPSVRYINTPIYNNTCVLEFKLLWNWNLEVKYKWEYIQDYSNLASFRIGRECKRYHFHLTYKHEWIDGKTEWNINGSISLKGY